MPGQPIDVWVRRRPFRGIRNDVRRFEPGISADILYDAFTRFEQAVRA
jgi:hypothetical protein